MSGDVTVLVNPAAGRGRARRAAGVVMLRLRQMGLQPRLFVGTTMEDMRWHAQQAVRRRSGRIVLVGGDGTLFRLLDIFAGTGIPIGMVPAGTGDDFARALGIPLDPAAAAALAVLGNPRRVDLGVIDSGGQRTHFATVAAMGVDALVAVQTDLLRWPKGPRRYYLALALELVRLIPIAYQVRIDDDEPRPWPGVVLAVANTSNFGGGLRIGPDADPTDGRFDLAHAVPLSRARLIQLFLLLRQGRHLGQPGVTSLRAGRIHVEAPELVVVADGELVCRGAADFSVRPGALTVMAPG